MEDAAGVAAIARVRPSLAARVVAAVCVALAATYLWVGDVTLAGAAVTLWPPVLWAMLLVPAALWTWLRGDRAGAALSAASLAVFVLLTTETRSVLRGFQPTPARSESSLRVVTWNVAGGAPYEELATLAPDIVFVQEASARPKDAAAFVAHHWTPMPDLALLTRWPVRVLPTESVGPWAAPQLALLDLPEGRRLLLANVRLALPSLVTAVANREWRLLGDAHSQRVGQYARLAGLVDRARVRHDASAVILAGDFNIPGAMRSLAPLRASLRDVWAQAGRGWGGTMTAALPLVRIDQIWVSGNVRETSARVLPRGGSDHRAVAVDLVVE